VEVLAESTRGKPRVKQSGGKPPQSKIRQAEIVASRGAMALGFCEAAFGCGDEWVALLRGAGELALGEVFGAAAFALEFF
jgi:hypothetical protein